MRTIERLAWAIGFAGAVALVAIGLISLIAAIGINGFLVLWSIFIVWMFLLLGYQAAPMLKDGISEWLSRLNNWLRGKAS